MYSLSPLLSLSCRTPLFVSPKETVYAPYPSLLCAHLLHFLSIPPHCLLSLSILPINHSAQSLPPTEAMSPPPPEMNDWQVCSVSNTQQDNMERGENGWLSSQREWGREGGWRERTSDILYLISYITACFRSCKHSPGGYATSSWTASPCLFISFPSRLSPSVRSPEVPSTGRPVLLVLLLIFARYCSG